MMVEWAALPSGKVVVATEQRSWLHDPSWIGDPFHQPMSCPGSLATTRWLLDGSLMAARLGSPPGPPRPALTRTRWVYRLAGYYHTTHATPPLMAEASRRFAAAGRTTLAEYAARKVVDESGHDRLALLDLRDLGLPGERVVESLVPSTARALVDYFERAVRQEDPIGSLGYAFALERLATTTDSAYFGAVASVLPPGVNATRCLKVHSGGSADADHVEDLVEVVSGLSAPERARVAVAAYETGLILFGQAPADVVPDETIERVLAQVLEQPPGKDASP